MMTKMMMVMTPTEKKTLLSFCRVDLKFHLYLLKRVRK